MLLHRDRRATLLWTKIGPPLRGRSKEGAGQRRLFAGCTATCCAALLASAFLRAITILILTVFRPSPFGEVECRTAAGAPPSSAAVLLFLLPSPSGEGPGVGPIHQRFV